MNRSRSPLLSLPGKPLSRCAAFFFGKGRVESRLLESAFFGDGQCTQVSVFVVQGPALEFLYPIVIDKIIERHLGMLREHLR